MRGQEFNSSAASARSEENPGIDADRPNHLRGGAAGQEVTRCFRALERFLSDIQVVQDFVRTPVLPGILVAFNALEARELLVKGNCGCADVV